MLARCSAYTIAPKSLPQPSHGFPPVLLHSTHLHPLRTITLLRIPRNFSTFSSGPFAHQTFQSKAAGVASSFYSTGAAKQHASSSSTGSGDANEERMGPLEGLMERLDGLAPRFGISHGGIRVLKGPSEFYEVLKEKILGAKRRIYLSTLYIGKTEHELIEVIAKALRENSELKISFLADALRGTRETPQPSCASLLAPLITEFGKDRVQIRLYHTPNLTGVRKKLIPRRINEGWGLQHMKLYGIDDEVILSGANLSNDYFTNRLDRYHLFSSVELTNYYERIHNAVSSISFDVQPSENDVAGYAMEWPAPSNCPSPLDDPKAYIAHASALLGPLVSPRSSTNTPINMDASTYVYPILQLTQLFSAPKLAQSLPTTADQAKSTEFPALKLLLQSLNASPFRSSKVTFTAGYFNPSKYLVSLLLSTEPANLTVITASPQANGFYKSGGISGLLPPAYTLLCRRFLEAVHAKGQPLATRARLLEWRRGVVGEEGGWTYHAKGLWVTLPRSGDADHEKGPSITVVGSSNYTTRSYTLDLEANALIVTRDPGLQQRLAEEEEWLKEDAKVMSLEDYQSTERRVGLHVRIAMWITTLVGGAL